MPTCSHPEGGCGEGGAAHHPGGRCGVEHFGEHRRIPPRAAVASGLPLLFPPRGRCFPRAFWAQTCCLCYIFRGKGWPILACSGLFLPPHNTTIRRDKPCLSCSRPRATTTALTGPDVTRRSLWMTVQRAGGRTEGKTSWKYLHSASSEKSKASRGGHRDEKRMQYCVGRNVYPRIPFPITYFIYFFYKYVVVNAWIIKLKKMH